MRSLAAALVVAAAVAVPRALPAQAAADAAADAAGLVELRDSLDTADAVVIALLTDVAEARHLDVARTVGLGRLRRGEYVLTVTVTAFDGRSAERRQFLNVSAK